MEVFNYKVFCMKLPTLVLSRIVPRLPYGRITSIQCLAAINHVTISVHQLTAACSVMLIVNFAIPRSNICDDNNLSLYGVSFTRAAKGKTWNVPELIEISTVGVETRVPSQKRRRDD